VQLSSEQWTAATVTWTHSVLKHDCCIDGALIGFADTEQDCVDETKIIIIIIGRFGTEEQVENLESTCISVGVIFKGHFIHRRSCERTAGVQGVRKIMERFNFNFRGRLLWCEPLTRVLKISDSDVKPWPGLLKYLLF